MNGDNKAWCVGIFFAMLTVCFVAGCVTFYNYHAVMRTPAAAIKVKVEVEP